MGAFFCVLSFGLMSCVDAPALPPQAFFCVDVFVLMSCADVLGLCSRASSAGSFGLMSCDGAFG